MHWQKVLARLDQGRQEMPTLFAYSYCIKIYNNLRSLIAEVETDCNSFRQQYFQSKWLVSMLSQYCVVCRIDVRIRRRIFSCVTCVKEYHGGDLCFFSFLLLHSMTQDGVSSDSWQDNSQKVFYSYSVTMNHERIFESRIETQIFHHHH